MAKIDNDGSDTLISGTSGNDTIYNNDGSKVTIEGGAGDDYIDNFNGDSTTIDAGDGNDYIYNYFSYKVKIYGGAGDDSITNIGGENVTITGNTGNDYIENYVGDDYISSVIFKYNIGDGNDTIVAFTNKDKLIISGGSYSTTKSGLDIIITVGKGQILLKNVYATATKVRINDETISLADTKILKLRDGNDSVVSHRSKVKIEGGTGNDTIGTELLEGIYHVSINGGAGNDYIENSEGTYITLEGGAGDDFIHNWFGENVTISGGIGNDSIITDRWSTNNLVKYTEGDGNDIIYEFDSDDTLSISGDSYSTATSGKNVIVTVGDGAITLDNAASLSSVNIKFKKTSNATNSWKLSGTTATYGTSTNTLIKVSGVKSLDGISLSGKVVTVAAAALNQTKVTLSGDGYTLKLANDVSTTATTSNAWSYKSSVATLKQTKGAYYSLASDGKTISYSKGTSKTLAKVSGVKSASGLSVKNKVITVAQAALNKSKVTLSGSGYKLKLANDVSTSATTSNAWSYKSSVATLGQTKGEKYSLASDGKTISYSAGTSKTLAKVSGVKSADGLSIKKKVITVAQAALNKSKITLSGSGYKLKLANDVSTTATTSDAWSYKNSVATLKQTKGEKYSLASNGKSISYSAGTSATLATVSGAKSKSGLSFNGKKITLKNSALNKKVTISGGYEFDFATDYKKAAITGSAKADTITSRGNNISITGGKGNDVINLAATAKNNMIVYNSGDGKDIINGLTEDDTIKIASGAAQVSASGADVIFTVGKGSLTVKDAADKTFTYIAGGVKETYSAIAAEPYTISGAAIVLSTSYTKTDFDVKDYGEGLKTIDASAAAHALNITGNDNDNKILGSSKNDTLDGYTGNDTLTGGDGSDIFLYYADEGNDVITDYTANDVIRIEEGEVIPTVKGRDVVLKVGKGKITVQNAAKNKIGVTYTENGVERDYINGKQAVAVNNTTVTITKDYWKNIFDVDNFGSGLKQIDASAVTHKLKITGNDKANQILGGTGNDTLAGGKGNDTLQGGDGSNLYVYNNGDGNDLIVSWGNRDSISIASGVLSEVTVKDDTAILKVGKGKISLQGALTEQLNWYDSDGAAHHTILSGAYDNVFEDNNFIAANNLSAIVEDKAVDYSVAKIETALPSANALQTLTYTRKFFAEKK